MTDGAQEIEVQLMQRSGATTQIDGLLLEADLQSHVPHLNP